MEETETEGEEEEEGVFVINLKPFYNETVVEFIEKYRFYRKFKML